MTSVAAPHLQADLQGLLEPLEPLADRGERDAQPARLLLVPGGADAEPGTPAGQHVQRGDGLGQVRAEAGRAVRGGEVRDLQADLHCATSGARFGS
jgi:hypothetical protein